jgi:cytochrome P450
VSEIRSSIPAVEYDPLQLHDDPYPLYRQLRDQAPVYHSEIRNCWILSRYEDVQAAARDWNAFSSAEGNDLDDSALLFAPSGELTHADPPDHKKLRDSIRGEFGVSKVRQELEPRIREKVKALLSRMRESEQIDFATQLAVPLPGSMVCGWLGFPEEDHPLVLGWFHSMIARVPGEVSLPTAALAARDHMRAYIKDAMADRRVNERDDLLTSIVQAIDSEKIDEDEGVGMTMLLFLAGITTTSALIANSLLNLSRFQEALRYLRAEPDKIQAGVEELLRFDAPIQWLTRVSTTDVALHEVEIPRGSRVVLLWGSANRDERRWTHPDELDMTRETFRHIAFGEGIHHCLGAPLARLETKVLLEEFLQAASGFEINGPVERIYAQSERTIGSLPARVDWS